MVIVVSASNAGIPSSNSRPQAEIEQPERGRDEKEGCGFWDSIDPLTFADDGRANFNEMLPLPPLGEDKESPKKVRSKLASEPSSHVLVEGPRDRGLATPWGLGSVKLIALVLLMQPGTPVTLFHVPASE